MNFIALNNQPESTLIDDGSTQVLTVRPENLIENVQGNKQLNFDNFREEYDYLIENPDGLSPEYVENEIKAIIVGEFGPVPRVDNIDRYLKEAIDIDESFAGEYTVEKVSRMEFSNPPANDVARVTYTDSQGQAIEKDFQIGVAGKDNWRKQLKSAGFPYIPGEPGLQ